MGLFKNFLKAAAFVGSTSGCVVVVPVPPPSAFASSSTFQRCAADAITEHAGPGTPQVSENSVLQNGWTVTRQGAGVQTFTPNVRDSELESAKKTADRINAATLRCM